MIQKSKQCTKCERILPLTSFHKHKPSKDGRKPRCKDCRCQLQRDYTKENPEKKKEQDRRYAEKNREKLRAKAKHYRQENLEAVKKRNAEYRRNNQEKLKMYFRNHYLENKKEKLAYAKQYAKENKKTVKQYQRKYGKENAERINAYQREKRAQFPEKYRLYSLAYLARKNNAEGSYDLDQWTQLCNFFNCVCPCCEEYAESFEADHIIPLTWDDTSNWITNIQPLCRRCNTSKGNHYAVDYRPTHVRFWAKEQAGYVFNM